MKKTILLIFACSSFGVFAQKGFYIGLQSGYGFNVGGANGSNTANNTTSVNPVNLGAGFVPSVTAGYFFNKNLGAELGIGYLSGKTYTKTTTTYSTQQVEDYQYSSFYVNPSLIFKTKIGIIQPYLKTGLFIGMVNKITDDYKNLYQGGIAPYSGTTEIVTESKNGLPLGFTGSLGVEIALGRHFGIYGEFFGRFATYSPSSYTSANTTTNGSTTYTSGEYKDDLVLDYSNRDLPARSYPINALGFNVGVRYYFKGNQ